MIVDRKEILNEDGSVGYIEAVFNSGNVLKSTYFVKDQRLYIAFKRGHMYSYENISPEIYEEFEEADSQGRFFHEVINGKYTYRKEFTLYPNEIDDANKIIEEKKKEDDGE